MRRAIPIALLMPGDILLYRGVDRVSDAIRLIDGSEVSHAGLFLGRFGQKGRTVSEVIRDGVIRRELSKSLEHAEWVESRRLKMPPASIEPVLDRAALYLMRGGYYAFEQIVLLAFLCITRNLFGSPVLGRFVRETLDAAASFLLHLVSTGREPMTGSEFVFRCYREALPGALDVLERAPGVLPFVQRRIPIGRRQGIHRSSALAVLLEKHGDALSTQDAGLEVPMGTVGSVDVPVVEEWIKAYFNDLQSSRMKYAPINLASPDLLPSFQRFAGSLYLTRHRQEKKELSWKELPWAAVLGELFDAAADFVTPGDLQRSRSLAFLGKIDKKGEEE